MIVGLIFEAIKTGFGWFKEKKKAKHAREMAQIENETRLLLSTNEANSKWDMAQLNDKDKIIRIAAFALFSSSFWSHLISPEFGQLVQGAWSSMPHWQANVLSGMSLSVFGLKKIPQLVGTTVGAIRQGLSRK